VANSVLSCVEVDGVHAERRPAAIRGRRRLRMGLGLRSIENAEEMYRKRGRSD